MSLEYHPLANLFPLIEGEEFDALVADIRANGIHDPIDLYQGKILDGRNRHRAAVAAEFELEKRHFRHYHPEIYGDPLAYVISKNLSRRHLDDRQRASIAGKIANFTQGGDRSKPPIGGLTVDQAAEKLNVAPRQVERARTVHEHGVPWVREALDRGEIAVSAAERIARLPEDEQVEIIRHRATMPTRQEPDGLDFAPTPPWGTRALLEIVLPALGISKITKPWEPACGQGHMAEVIAEYAPVAASDIHDYGYGDSGVDFLEQKSAEPLADWIITNPPFNKAEEFSLQALRLARVGVAMFTRWQWIETVGRFERLFGPNPPAIVAVFAERIPLHMGRWEPDGDTLTAYCWVVWRKGFAGDTRLFWIPPGQRKALTKDDDRVRFTTSSVTRKEHVYCDEPFDTNTGEIAEPDATAGFIEDSASSDEKPQQSAPSEANVTTTQNIQSEATVNRELGPASLEPAIEPVSASQADAGSPIPEHDAPRADADLEIPAFLDRRRAPQPAAEAG